MANVLRKTSHGQVNFYCEGCRGIHNVPVDPNRGPAWTWNQDMVKPTFSPSILIDYNGPDAGQTDVEGDTAPPAICHSFVVDGVIAYCGDSTHHLSGQSVPLLDIENGYPTKRDH